MQYAIHSQILVLTQDKIGSPSCSEGKGVTATNQHILKKTMSSTRILSLALCILSLQQQHTNAFTDRLIVRTPRFSTAASFSPKSSTPLNWARPQRDKECREHKALSIPFSGPPVDYRDHNQSWNDDCNLTSQPTSDCFDAAPSQKALLAGIVSAGALGFYALLTMSSPGSWRYFVAGGICAATSHSIPTPIDVIKVRKRHGCVSDAIASEEIDAETSLGISSYFSDSKTGRPFSSIKVIRRSCQRNRQARRI